MKARDEREEDANSMHEESHVSNRHTTRWQNAWWVRVNNGPHLRTARDRRKVWRAATRAAQEVRETGKVAEREREEWEKGKTERRESNTLHIVLHLQPTAAAPALAAFLYTKSLPMTYLCVVLDVYAGIAVMKANPLSHAIDLLQDLHNETAADDAFNTFCSETDAERPEDHQLCARCRGGRLRLPSKFPVMPVSRWWSWLRNENASASVSYPMWKPIGVAC